MHMICLRWRGVTRGGLVGELLSKLPVAGSGSELVIKFSVTIS